MASESLMKTFSLAFLKDIIAIIFTHEFLIILASKIEASETHHLAINFKKHKLNFSACFVEDCSEK